MKCLEFFKHCFVVLENEEKIKFDPEMSESDLIFYVQFKNVKFYNV